MTRLTKAAFYSAKIFQILLTQLPFICYRPHLKLLPIITVPAGKTRFSNHVVLASGLTRKHKTIGDKNMNSIYYMYLHMYLETSVSRKSEMV